MAPEAPALKTRPDGNLDPETVEGFGYEWSRFDQSKIALVELAALFEDYFSVMPPEVLNPRAVGFDLGCGSGRWAQFVAPRVGRLHCIDASPVALAVAKRSLSQLHNCVFHCASVDNLPLPDDSMDFAYSLGVLHHVPDTGAGLRACARKLKPGAPLLVYVYYALENRPLTYRLLWRASDALRRFTSRLPRPLCYGLSLAVACLVYWPLARGSRLLESAGISVEGIPLAFYRRRSLATMRTDAFDRLATRLERRFTRDELAGLMRGAGLRDLTFRDAPPYWCVVGFRDPVG